MVFASCAGIMAFDSTLPVNSSLISAVELRNQFNALNTLIEDNNSFVLSEISSAVSGSAANVNAIDDLSFSISDPPTQTEVQDILDKLNQLIAALKRP